MYDFSYTAENIDPLTFSINGKQIEHVVFQVSWLNVWLTFNMEKSHYHDNK